MPDISSHALSIEHVAACTACWDSILAKHDLSTIHLAICDMCRQFHRARSEKFVRSTQPGGEIHAKMAELGSLVDEVMRLRAEGKIP